MFAGYIGARANSIDALVSMIRTLILKRAQLLSAGLLLLA